ncbi:NADH-cytochrome b5 reductase, partial [Coemansia sp. S610]
MSSDSGSLVYVVGILLAAGIAFVLLNTNHTKSKSASAGPALHSSEYRKFKLVKKVQLSPNTARYRFALPASDASLGLPIGRHIQLMATVDGKEIAR